MKGWAVVHWCGWCWGLGGAGHMHSHPLATTRTNLQQIRRSVISTRRRDSDDETEEEEEGEEEEEEEEKEKINKSCVPRRRHGSSLSLRHLPSTTAAAIRVQPSAVDMHRPDLQDIPRGAPHPDESFLHAPKPSPLGRPSSGASRLRTCSSNSLASSTPPPPGSLDNMNICSQLQAPTGHITAAATTEVEDDLRGRRKFLTPEEAASPPQQTPSRGPAAGSRLVVFPPRAGSGWGWGSAGYLRSLLALEEPVSYAGQYSLHGSSKPVKLRSHNTLRAISTYQGRAETINNPVWYSFGRLQLALRYRCHANRLDVEVVRVTHLPPGRERVNLDLQVRVTPGKKEKWMKMVAPGVRPEEDIHSPSCSLKIGKVSERRLVVSGYVPGVRSHAHLGLGHGIIPDLGAHQLTHEWQTFTLPLRQGIQVQDHLGLALVALSCCERVRGHLSVMVDLLHLRNIKVLRLGSNVVTSFKTRVSVWVEAVVMTESRPARRKELRSTPLERPKDRQEHGWEVMFKNNCSTTFSIPMEKMATSCVVLEVHGRARQKVMFSEALLGKVILGPEELFGGEDDGRPVLAGAGAGAVACVSVPGTATGTGNAPPLDTRLTHWGLAITRRAKVEMWHRLQI